MSRTPPLRIFFPATAHLLTDHLPHGEGLIAFNLLSGLAARGHVVVACAHALALGETPRFSVSAIGHGGPLESVAPLGYAGLAARELHRRGGADAFDVAHWLFPQGGDQVLDALPRRLPLVVGPMAQAWPSSGRAELTAGAVVRRAAQPAFKTLNGRAMGPRGADPDLRPGGGAHPGPGTSCANPAGPVRDPHGELPGGSAAASAVDPVRGPPGPQQGRD
jgi:hypothetical protein